jgi:short-subunit dehydrogenase
MEQARMPSETVLITGASSGIGLELARLFAADRSDLVLVARRRERLDELADELVKRHGTAVRVLDADLADPQSPVRLFERLAQDQVTIDVLVNNAGFGAHGRFAELNLERQTQMVQVNVLAATLLARLFLPGMLARGRGGILNVASTAAFQPGPYMAVYYATKAYLLSLSEALADEVRGKGVIISCLAPGPTATGFAAAADMTESLLFKYAGMTGAQVARIGHAGFRAGRPLVIPGVMNRIGAFSVRFAPRRLVRKVTARLHG